MATTQFQDELERAEVEEILAELDAMHPARSAYSQGVRTLDLARLVHQSNVRKRLEAAYRAALERYLKHLPPHD
jgi:hypothetical protein